MLATECTSLVVRGEGQARDKGFQVKMVLEPQEYKIIKRNESRQKKHEVLGLSSRALQFLEIKKKRGETNRENQKEQLEVGGKPEGYDILEAK